MHITSTAFGNASHGICLSLEDSCAHCSTTSIMSMDTVGKYDYALTQDVKLTTRRPTSDVLIGLRSPVGSAKIAVSTLSRRS